MQAPAPKARRITEAPLEYSAQDGGFGRYNRKQPDEGLLQYKERVRKALYEHSGTPEEVIDEVMKLPEVFYRALRHACRGDEKSAKSVLEKYVRKVSHELTRLVNDPEDMLRVYEVMETGVGYMEGSTGLVGKIAGPFIRLYFDRIIQQEEERLGIKKKLEGIVRE